jgi:hypothetical protein
MATSKCWPKTKVLLWVYDEQLRAMLDNMVLAEHRCRYNWQTRQISKVRDGVFYTTRFASPQGSFLPLNPRDSFNSCFASLKSALPNPSVNHSYTGASRS